MFINPIYVLINQFTYKTLIGIANKELVYSRKKPDTEIALNFKMGFT